MDRDKGLITKRVKSKKINGTRFSSLSVRAVLAPGNMVNLVNVANVAFLATLPLTEMFRRAIAIP